MAGITVWNFYFRLFSGSIKAPQVIDFLEHLLRQIGSKLIIIWDGLPVHRSRLVREFVTQQRGQIHLEYLPAYAPEASEAVGLVDAGGVPGVAYFDTGWCDQRRAH